MKRPVSQTVDLLAGMVTHNISYNLLIVCDTPNAKDHADNFIDGVIGKLNSMGENYLYMVFHAKIIIGSVTIALVNEYPLTYIKHYDRKIRVTNIESIDVYD